MGLTVITDDKGVKVIRKDKTSKSGNPYTQYSLMYSSKDKEGNWVNGFIDCEFKKGVEVNNKAKIKIKNSFPICDEYNGNKRNKIKIMDFEVIENGEGATKTTDDDGFMIIPEGSEEELIFM